MHISTAENAQYEQGFGQELAHYIN